MRHEVLWSDVEAHWWRISGRRPDAEDVVDFLEGIGVDVIGAPHLRPPGHEPIYQPGPLDNLIVQVYDAQIKAYLDAPPPLRRVVP